MRRIWDWVRRKDREAFARSAPAAVVWPNTFASPEAMAAALNAGERPDTDRGRRRVARWVLTGEQVDLIDGELRYTGGVREEPA